MTRYVLVDYASGYVWGEARAESPAAACEVVERLTGEDTSRRRYEMHGANSHALTDGQSGYLVHEAPAEFPPVEDGRSRRTIEAVSALPLVARVVTRSTEADA